MNKKLIKILGIVTCGLGGCLSISNLSTSCSKNQGGDEPIPPVELKLVQSVTDDWFVSTYGASDNYFYFLNKTKEELSEWKNEGYNGITLPKDSHNGIVPFYDADDSGREWPSFLSTINLPENIKNSHTYLVGVSDGCSFSEKIKKIIFDSSEFSFDGDTTFRDSQNLECLQFNNINSLSFSNFYTGTNKIGFKNCGTAVNGTCKIIFGDSISQQKREDIYNQLISLGLDGNKWKYNQKTN